MASGRRPEHKAPPELFYNEEEARKYTSNTRMIEIQVQLTHRALELLNLPEHGPSYVLDVGICSVLSSGVKGGQPVQTIPYRCGSGLSGEVLTDEGHHWVGFDISPAMLDVAREKEVEGDVFLHDAGHGLGFRPGTFDGCISISTLQWLCNADKKDHNPPKRLYKFFSSLYSSLARGSRAVFQFYPENPQQVELITTQAMRAGFSGGLVVDYPNSTRAKKIFLCLFAGVVGDKLPKGLGTEDTQATSNSVAYSGTRARFKNLRGKSLKSSKEWIKEKKERRRRQGREVRQDSKYTGRKRKNRF